MIVSQTLDVMDSAFREMETAVPRPRLSDLGYGPVFRYIEKDIFQAIILKLVRLQNSLRAAQSLLRDGFILDQGSLHRIIDELNEDILFLVDVVQ